MYTTPEADDRYEWKLLSYIMLGQCCHAQCDASVCSLISATSSLLDIIIDHDCSAGVLQQAELAAKGMPDVSAILISAKATTSASASMKSAACQKRFGHWCLDGKRLSKAGVGGIIAGGCLVIVLMAGYAVYQIWRRRKAALAA